LQGRAGVHALATAAEALPVGDGELEAVADSRLSRSSSSQPERVAQPPISASWAISKTGWSASSRATTRRAADQGLRAAAAAAEPATSSSSLRHGAGVLDGDEAHQDAARGEALLGDQLGEGGVAVAGERPADAADLRQLERRR
jgi:hypothetical protein